MIYVIMSIIIEINEFSKELQHDVYRQMQYTNIHTYVSIFTHLHIYFLEMLFLVKHKKHVYIFKLQKKKLLRLFIFRYII